MIIYSNRGFNSFSFPTCRYTELEIAVPEIGIVGLHAENLGIGSVWVDGEPTEFEYYPHHQQQSEDDKRWSTVDSPSSAADAAGSVYLSSLEKELVPNLLINCCKPFKIDSEQQEQPLSENGVPSSAKAKQVIVALCIQLHPLLLLLANPLYLSLRIYKFELSKSN